MTIVARRAALAVAPVALLFLRALPTFADLTGSVGISMEATGDVRSAAVSEYWNDWGTAIDFDVQIQFTHVIHRSENSESAATLNSSSGMGQVYSHLTLTNTVGYCYRARLNATAIRSGYSSTQGVWYSAFEVCNILDVPPPDESQCYEYCSPIVIDLDSNGFQLSGVDDPVSFDIDGDGVVEQLAWTAGGGSDAFLALDRNGNGRIDSGRELFGIGTLMASGARAPNGYEALFEYDLAVHGGNGSGFIDSGDAAFAGLLLWSDRNHNGLTDSGELSSLTDARLLSLECDYRAVGRRDGHGNYFRYQGWAWAENPAGSPRPVLTYDVFFRLVE